MQKLIVTSLAGMLAITAPLPSHAVANYRGMCRMTVFDDTTPGGLAGGAHNWAGEVDAVIVSTVPGAAVRATCTLKINGVVFPPVFTATLPGIQFVANAGRAQFFAYDTDVVTLCTDVTINGVAQPTACQDLTRTPVCPDPLCGAGGLLDLLTILDPTLCPILVSLAPLVDSLVSDVYVDPSQGDIYVAGTGSGDLFWDCPPYDPDAVLLGGLARVAVLTTS